MIADRPGAAQDSRVDEGRVQAAADANFVASLTSLVNHVAGAASQEFRGVTAVVTGLPVALFNGCFALGDADADALDDAIRWIATASVPYRVWIREGLGVEVTTVQPRHGLAMRERLFPGMALRPIPTAPSPQPGVAVHRVGDTADLAEYRGVLVADGAAPDMVARLLPESLLADPALALFTASLDARPAGTALALRTGSTVGVYNVSTLPWARRRGVGTAATWAAVDDGRASGCELAVLQSSAMGQAVYEAMGFHTVVRYLEFVQPGG